MTRTDRMTAGALLLAAGVASLEFAHARPVTGVICAGVGALIAAWRFPYRHPDPPAPHSAAQARRLAYAGRVADDPARFAELVRGAGAGELLDPTGDAQDDTGRP